MHNTRNNTKPVKWSDSHLSHIIDMYAYTMVEMGRQRAFSEEARNSGDYDGMRMYDSRAEEYRTSASALRTDIMAQIELRREVTAISDIPTPF